MLSSLRRRGDAGSIALVTIVLVILATLAAALVARVSSEGRRVGDRDDRAAALAAADGGLAAAQARIAAGEAASFRTSGGPDPMLAWSAEATPVGEQRWEVRSEGRSGRLTITVRADVVAAKGAGWHLERWEQLAVDSAG